MRRLQGVPARWVVDALVVVAAISSSVGTALRDDLHGGQRWFEVIAVGGVVLVLVLRDRWPFLAPVATWVSCSALSFLDHEIVTSLPGMFLAGMGAALLLGSLRTEWKALGGLAAIVVGAVVIIQHQPDHNAGNLTFTPLLFAASWFTGYALRERAEQTQAAEERAAWAERERESAARVAVAEERARIARELHDVVAHALSVMVLQVGVVRRRHPPAQAEDREALSNVERAGRAALTEMRRLLDAMRRDDEALELGTNPGLHDLDSLLTEVRSTGLDVRLHVHGERFELPPVMDLSAYRIVQEGLTNTLKHAGASRADVEVTYGARELVLSVTDDGPRSAANGTAHNGAAPGHGLVGIRERVTIFGGEMRAGAVADGYQLRATLPRDGFEP